eukprot:4255766-Alexandrium_andersonii.AAC.1
MFGNDPALGLHVALLHAVVLDALAPASADPSSAPGGATNNTDVAPPAVVVGAKAGLELAAGILGEVYFAGK